MRVRVKPELLRWACARAGVDADALEARFPNLRAWECEDVQPTLKQLEDFAKATYVPIGYLFLSTPPIEQIPIPDFRTIGNARIAHPSPHLLDTVYTCQQRQEWYRDFARSMAEDAHPFVASADLTSSVEQTAVKIRDALGFSVQERRQCSTWTDALRRFIEQADEAGVLVMVSGIVGSNTRRKLDPEEFRGFALSDPHAPLVFINGSDTKAAQMFTLAHELAHVWLGASGVSDVAPDSNPANATEQWCNQVAAELLVPLAILRGEYRSRESIENEMTRLARFFKVSTLVILRRIHDLGKLSDSAFRKAYATELARLKALVREGSGGDFYLTQAARVGKRFARALIVSTLEGQTLHRDAFRLLGFSKLATFHELGLSLGIS